jgi:hypothetical protein
MGGSEKLPDEDAPECCSPLTGRGRAGRALQVRGEPLAAADVASLRVRV